MSSTNKTHNLGLNDWLGSDVPERSDFNGDNHILDIAHKGLLDDIDARATRVEVEELKSQLGEKVGNNELKELESNLQSQLDEKAGRDELNGLGANIQSQLDGKSERGDLENAKSELQAEIEGKASVSDVEGVVSNLQEQIDNLELGSGNIALSDAVNETSGHTDGIAATPLAVKTAYDRAQEAYELASQSGGSGDFYNWRNGAAISAGSAASATGDRSIALGSGASATDAYGIALGSGASATDIFSTAMGGRAAATGVNSMALGRDAVAASSAMAIGSYAEASDGAMAIGSYAEASDGACIAIGSRASATDAYGIALGSGASATGNRSAALGVDASAAGLNSTALGYGASTSSVESRIMRLGSTVLSALSCSVELTVTSDKRDKTDITSIANGLDFINRVAPIAYVRNDRQRYLDRGGLSEGDWSNYQRYGICEYDRESHAAGKSKGERVRVGVSAQQVQDALTEVYGSPDYANLVNDNLYDVRRKGGEIPDGIESQLTVNYSGLIPFLIKAIQELSDQVEELKYQLNNR